MQFVPKVEVSILECFFPKHSQGILWVKHPFASNIKNIKMEYGNLGPLYTSDQGP
jgi:hypothetical protein